MTRRSLVLIAMLAASRAAAAQELAIAGADRETLAQLNQIVTSANERGLPTEYVIGEARFAASFHAEGPRIVRAARKFADWLAQAREALAPNPTPDDIAAGAQALKNDIPAATLTRIRQARGNRPVAVHVGLLIQLVKAPLELRIAEKTVLDLIRRSATNEQLAALGNEVSNSVRLGRAPDDALDRQFKKLNAVLAPGGGTSTLSIDVAAPAAATPPAKKKP